jgi:hypothetical protein
MPITLSNLVVRLLLAGRPRRRVRAATRLRLPANATLRADGPVTVHCTHGALWVTQAGDPADHVVPARQSWHTSRRGRVVIQALAPATVIVRTPAATGRIRHFLLPSTRRRAVA